MKVKVMVLTLTVILVSCTSQPYITKTVIDKEKGTQVDTVCTHKKAVVPWVLPGVIGATSFKYGQECHDESKDISKQ
jgi:hypothetical protein